MLVLVVKSRADTVADQAAQPAADRRAGKPVSRAAAGDGSTEQRARPRAKQSPGVFFRPWPHPIRAAGAGRKCNTESG